MQKPEEEVTGYLALSLSTLFPEEESPAEPGVRLAASDPPVSIPTALGLQHLRKPHLAFCMGFGVLPRACAASVIPICRQVLPSPARCLLNKRLS